MIPKTISATQTDELSHIQLIGDEVRFCIRRTIQVGDSVINVFNLPEVVLRNPKEVAEAVRTITDYVKSTYETNQDAIDAARVAGSARVQLPTVEEISNPTDAGGKP